MDAPALASSWDHPAALEIQSARAQLAAEEQKLQLLLAQVEASRDRITALKQVISPIRCVPPETLGEIITIAATAPRAPAQVLRTLSSVCRFWHDTTLKTPEAWTKIHFKYDTNAPPGPRTWLRTVRDVQEWFQHSGKAKKDVRVSVQGMPGEALTTLMDLIGAHSEQLRVLAVESVPTDQATLLNALLARSMPYLEEWTFYTSKAPSIIPRRSTAPVLRRMIARVEDLERMLPLEREQLTSLGIPPIKSAELPRFIDLCDKGGFPALRTLAIHDVDKLHQLPDSISITLPALEAFHMSFDSEDAERIMVLFSGLIMPNLATLSLCSELGNFLPMKDYGDANEASSQLADMLHELIDTSEPQLRRLYLDSISLIDWHLRYIVERLPLLERLALVNMPITDSFTYPSGQTCPRLTHVYVSPNFTDPEHRPLGLGDMATTVQGRVAAAARSRRVAKPTHVRIDDIQMVEVDGRILWSQDENRHRVEHPWIFRDAYMPLDCWWRMDAYTIGRDLEGL
ncbi:hypothetical protein AURDEDRAFT_158944 [Auricularia subglabra TFB-10046 SS5]|nr:hypothetical protein AURDEDRAFT_158944 [Auricularia subglabra TFB-10046 SS5]